MATLSSGSTTTTLTELIATEIIDDMVIDAAYSTTVMRPLVTNRSVSGQNTDTVEFPAWNALSAASVGETSDLSNTAIDTTSVTITTGEVGILTTLSDSALEDTLRNIDTYATQLGKGVADKQDADIAALLSSFSNTTGDNTNGLSQDDFLEAIRELDSRDAPAGYVAVLHPVQTSQISRDVVITQNSEVFAASAPQDARFGARPRGMWGELFNVPIFHSTNVPTNTRTNPVYDGGMFSSEALAFVSEREIRVEAERDASLRATEIAVTSRYGTGETLDSYGETLFSNQTAL